VHQIVFRGADEGSALRAILAAARRQCAAGWVMQELSSVVPSTLYPLVEAALGQPEAVTSVARLADAVGAHRKTLFNRCARADCVPPAELLAWCRLALVAYHLENTGCTIETIAIELGYPSDTALRNAMKRYTGLRAGEIRERGGVLRVVDAFRRRLRDWQTGRIVAPGVTLRIARRP
jgi:AraC-like DNA-binding protein